MVILPVLGVAVVFTLLGVALTNIAREGFFNKTGWVLFIVGGSGVWLISMAIVIVNLVFTFKSP